FSPRFRALLRDSFRCPRPREIRHHQEAQEPAANPENPATARGRRTTPEQDRSSHSPSPGLAARRRFPRTPPARGATSLAASTAEVYPGRGKKGDFSRLSNPHAASVPGLRRPGLAKVIIILTSRIESIGRPARADALERSSPRAL